MAFFTKERIHNLAEAQGIQTRRMMTESVLNQFKILRSVTPITSARDESKVKIGSKTFDIFLSHSSIDSSLVLALYLILTNRGYKVYLDRIHDPNLNRLNVTKNTAETIRKRMTQSNSLFIATTSNTTKSKWVPWELGFTDGLTGKAAILPILDSTSSIFSGLSYFELYPTVEEKVGSYKPNDLEIKENYGNATTWGKWIHKNTTY